MEKKDEFVEMRVRTIDEAMNVDKLIGLVRSWLRNWPRLHF